MTKLITYPTATIKTDALLGSSLVAIFWQVFDELVNMMVLDQSDCLSHPYDLSDVMYEVINAYSCGLP